MNKDTLKEITPVTLFGSRFVLGYPMTRLQYNSLRGWDLPSDENGDDAGLLIENLTNSQPNTDFLNGYVSWQTIEQANAEFRQTGNFPFGMAIEALKLGHCVSRWGWNGKGMFLKLINPYNNDQYSVTEKETLIGTLMPHIVMKTVDNQLIPWLASQADILAEDYSVVNFSDI